jgi:hypothetical protein
MQSRRIVSIVVALGFGAAAACQQPSADERIVGIWQFSGMDATMDYVFKADHTFELWAPSMDLEQSKGPWLQMDFGIWHIKADELIIEYKRPCSPEFEEFLKSEEIALPTTTRHKVVRYAPDRIEFDRGGPFIRAAARRGI